MKRGQKARTKRRIEAEARQAEREKRTPADQLALTVSRRGYSMRERARLGAFGLHGVTA